MRITISPRASEKPPVFVVLKLGGGMDALYAVPPLDSEQQLRDLRPTLNPEHYRYNFGHVSDVHLDGRFGLHPALHHLRGLYETDRMGIIYGIGSPNSSLSHFDSTKLLEQGGRELGGYQSGWLGRYMRVRQAVTRDVMAVSTSTTGSPILSGCEVLQLPKAKAPSLNVPASWGDSFSKGLWTTYAGDNSISGQAGKRSLRTIETLGNLASQKPSVPYPSSGSARELSIIGNMVNAEIGVEVAIVDFPDWDVHDSQAVRMDRNLLDLSSSIEAFFNHIADKADNVILMTISEFGRRAAENTAKGTDHGRGTVSFVCGDNIAGGKVHGTFAGLAPEQLDSNGNIPITTDYRDVFTELLQLGIGDGASKVFRK